MAGALGFEPRNDGIKTRCLTTWRRPNYSHSPFREFACVIGVFEHRFNVERIANAVGLLPSCSRGKSGGEVGSALPAFRFHSPDGYFGGARDAPALASTLPGSTRCAGAKPGGAKHGRRPKQGYVNANFAKLENARFSGSLSRKYSERCIVPWAFPGML
jgi:hypothetical protein